MDDLQRLIDLHEDGPRQGPGGDRETCLAIGLSGLARASGLKIADIGCGTGSSTLVLARELDAHVTAVDCIAPFLARLEEAARDAGMADRITTLAASMQALPFAEAQFDAIWSEGAIYNMGFESGVQAWRKFLKPGGVLAVSELTWLTDQRPAPLQAHWNHEYPQVDTASAKFALLERHGYSPIGYFVLPEHCWHENYYQPMQQRFRRFLDRHQASAEAVAIVKAEQHEIALYQHYGRFFGYGYYVARKA